MLKKYVGKERVRVSVLGTDFGIVEEGQKIAVPKELAESVSWSPVLWQDVKSKKDA